MGNSDAFLLDAVRCRRSRSTERQLDAARLDARAAPAGLTSSYMRSFEPTVELDLDGLRLLCFHGTPDDYDEVVLPDDPPDAVRRHRRRRARRRPRPRAAAAARRRARWYVNPGSVGLGYDHLQPDGDFRFDPWASYAIVERGVVEFHRVPFDLDELDASHAERPPARPRKVFAAATGVPRADAPLQLPALRQLLQGAADPRPARDRRTSGSRWT